MDLKVYRKEEVKQPSGSEYVYVPDVIDIYPEYDETETSLKNAETIDSYEDTLEQASALATIWQRGLDPLALDNGNRWSELYLGEINVIQIMEDLTDSVQEVSPSVAVDFDTVQDANGNSYFSYKLKVVA